MRVKALVLVLLVALPLAAQEYEQLMLPVAPSLVFCAYESRYETRLVAFNDHAAMASRFCADDRCHELEPKTGSEITNVESGGTPLPVFLYVPKETADSMRMSLTVEASNKDHLDERGFTELPIVRASDFTEGKLQLVGLRMDPGFRQTVRMFGLDGAMSGYVMMRAYKLNSNELLFEWPFYVGPISNEQDLRRQATAAGVRDGVRHQRVPALLRPEGAHRSRVDDAGVEVLGVHLRDEQQDAALLHGAAARGELTDAAGAYHEHSDAEGAEKSESLLSAPLVDALCRCGEALVPPKRSARLEPSGVDVLDEVDQPVK